MRITSISIRNFMGINEAKYDLGQVTEISGKNGRGKTTIVEALQNALGGGDLAKLQNIDAEGEAELGLSIDNGAFLIERKGKDTVVKQRVGDSAAYEKVRKPQTFLDAWYDAMLSNPMRLYKASPKDQLDILLEILAQDLKPEQITAALGPELWPAVAPIVQAGGHPLALLTAVHQALYDERTGVNRSKLDKERTAQTVRTGIPADIPAASTEVIVGLERERDSLAGEIEQAKAQAEHVAGEILTKASAAHDTRTAEVAGEFKAKAANLRRAADKTTADLTAEAEAKINEIRAALATRVAAAQADVQEQIDAARKDGEVILNEAETAMEAARLHAEKTRRAMAADVDAAVASLGDVKAKLDRARGDAEQYTRLIALKNEADRHETEAKTLAGRAAQLTAGMEAVEGLKAGLLKDLPIPGLECDGKTIKLDRVPLEQKNKEARLTFAAQVAALRAQKHPLKLVFIDDAEALDTEHRELLLAELERRGVQIIVARVTDSALTVAARESVAKAS